jgi:hypothetical protein
LFHAPSLIKRLLGGDRHEGEELGIEALDTL